MEQHADVTITSTPREGNPVTISDKVISRLTGVAEEGSQIRNLNENEVTIDQKPMETKEQNAINCQQKKMSISIQTKEKSSMNYHRKRSTKVNC